MKVIPPVKTYFPDEDIQWTKGCVERILGSGMLTMGEYTREFENRFANLCGAKHAIAVNSGTSALEIALRSFCLEGNDEVLVPTNTFSSTAATVFFAGGKPVFTDINPETLCIDAENVRKYVNPRTRGVMAVHIGGLICPDILEIKKICEDEGMFLIEDAAHAHGSTLKGRHAGTFGDAGCYSFYPTKVMTTAEGGMVITDDDGIAEVANVLRDQGKKSFQDGTIVRLGYNWRLPEISAAIGLAQLRRLPEILKRRSLLARFYDEELRKIDGIKPLKVPTTVSSCYYKYVCILSSDFNRDWVKRRLKEKGIMCGGEVYWPPLHMHPAYMEKLKTKEGDFPVAEDVCKRMLCLPMYTQMSMEDAAYVVEKIKETLHEATEGT